MVHLFLTSSLTITDELSEKFTDAGLVVPDYALIPTRGFYDYLKQNIYDAFLVIIQTGNPSLSFNTDPDARQKFLDFIEEHTPIWLEMGEEEEVEQIINNAMPNDRIE